MNTLSKWGRWNPDCHPLLPETITTHRHRVNLGCNECEVVLSVEVTGVRDLEAVRSRVIAAMVEIAALDGWADDVCPACRRWAQGTVGEARPVSADAGAHLLVARERAR